MEIKDIDLTLIDDFPNHPFKVKDDEEMLELADSVANNGVLLPALVRPKENGRFEMISGHRRKRASEMANIPTIKCMVCNYDDDTAAIVMVDTNLQQRKNIPPSEKAFAYQIKLEAMKHKVGRPLKNSDPLGPNLIGSRSNEELASQSNDSVSQIKRYIRLTNLVPELLEFVDEGRIGMRPAVEMSYLDEDAQRDIVDFIDENECFPSHAQTIQLRKLFNDGKLDTNVISEILSEEKGNQHEKLVFRGDRVRKLLPKTLPVERTEEYVCKALEYYNRFLQRQRSRDER
ncbi:MAG: ParB/RepB/Spo0J family partition protein [Eubacterium sp.]|nr:ParB/RepB/Spo0J family partition protein [Eubacterium sp.]